MTFIICSAARLLASSCQWLFYQPACGLLRWPCRSERRRGAGGLFVAPPFCSGSFLDQTGQNCHSNSTSHSTWLGTTHWTSRRKQDLSILPGPWSERIVLRRCCCIEASDGVDNGITAVCGPNPQLRRTDASCPRTVAMKDIAVRRRRVSPTAAGRWLPSSFSNAVYEAQAMQETTGEGGWHTQP